MSPADIAAINDLVTKGGLQFVLISLVVVLFLLYRWAMGEVLKANQNALDSMREERDNWRVIALTGIRTAEKGVTMAEFTHRPLDVR
jgi:hypothetical protein